MRRSGPARGSGFQYRACVSQSYFCFLKFQCAAFPAFFFVALFAVVFAATEAGFALAGRRALAAGFLAAADAVGFAGFAVFAARLADVFCGTTCVFFSAFSAATFVFAAAGASFVAVFLEA